MREVLAIAVFCGCGFDHGRLVVTDGAATVDGAGDGTAVRACPPGYAALASAPSLYRIVGGMGTPEPGRTHWVGAEADCRDDGGGAFRETHLAIADTAAEHQAFESVIGASAVSGASKWLGVTDRKVEGTWVPITGVMPWFTDWGASAPNNNTYNNCLLLDRTLVDSAVTCQDTSGTYDKGFICECDDQPVDLSTF